jgi:hypothetical protein
MQLNHQRILQHTVSCCVFIFLSMVLTACDGDGSGQNDERLDTPELEAVYTAEAEPGEIVTLSAQADEANTDEADYQWSQMSGPDVVLSDDTDRNAHFVMPPVDKETELTFIVDVFKRDGSVISEMHSISSANKSARLHHPSSVVTEQFVVFE